jgi:hypothetical protein
VIAVEPVTTIAQFTFTSAVVTEIDFAWAPLDRDRIRAQMKDDPTVGRSEITLPTYCGPLDGKPQSGEAYSFAAWNRVALEQHPGPTGEVNILDRQASYELAMEYKGEDAATGKYAFKLARRHQGHDYYRGASGAPIVDPSGQIVSMVLEGNEATDTIWGLPLAQYGRLVGLGDA